MSEITEQLIALIRARDAAGLAKYGVTLDRKDLTIEEWLMHQAEELADGAGYALAAMREVKELRAKLDKAVEALEHIEEYWNRNQNEKAMADALWHMLETAHDAIAAIKETK